MKNEKVNELVAEKLDKPDRLIKEKDEQEISQINNIENMKKELVFQKDDSFLSIENNDKLNKIFGQYPYGIESLINGKNIEKDQVFLIMIFNGTTEFIQKYIHLAKRKSSFAEDFDGKEKINIIELKYKSLDEEMKNDDELKKSLIELYKNDSDKNKFIKYINDKINQTQKYIQVLKNTFKELNKTEDKLIEKITFYFGQRLSEKLKNQNIEYFNKCSIEIQNYEENHHEKIDKSLLKYYYELSFEDFILIFSCIISYYTGLEIKLELRNEVSTEVFLSLFCNGEENYEKLADFFGYELQLKPYALKIENYSIINIFKIKKTTKKNYYIKEILTNLFIVKQLILMKLVI